MHVEDGKNFGERLREARMRAGLSQSELEEISGIPKARLSRYENGHVEPSIQTLARLSRALNVSEASLLGDQRAILEDFFQVLYARGVRITSKEQGIRLAFAVADMIEALGGSIPGPDAQATAAITVPPSPEVKARPTWPDSPTQVESLV
jgi:transcriptional regulator with XRE-family HTH domain